MSFCSYKNGNPSGSPGLISGDALCGLQEKVAIQVKRVYDCCIWQKALEGKEIEFNEYALVPKCHPTHDNSCCTREEQHVAPCPPIHFESCRSCGTRSTLQNLTVERLCDRPCFARVKATVVIPIDILFTDSHCREYIAHANVTVDRDVLLAIPDESIVPYEIESMASAICVGGSYIGNNKFKMTICVSIVMKVLAEVEICVPSYGFVSIPPCEEYAENICEEFFSLPLFPPASLCNESNVTIGRCCCDKNCRR